MKSSTKTALIVSGVVVVGVAALAITAKAKTNDTTKKGKYFYDDGSPITNPQGIMQMDRWTKYNDKGVDQYGRHEWIDTNGVEWRGADSEISFMNEYRSLRSWNYAMPAINTNPIQEKKKTSVLDTGLSIYKTVKDLIPFF